MVAVSLADRIGKRLRKSARWFTGFWRVKMVLPILVLMGKRVPPIAYFQWLPPFIERAEFSQNGEDGIIEAIFRAIGTTNRFSVEFGAEDGRQCNSRYLKIHRGWTGLLMDGNEQSPASGVKQEFITAENINTLFLKYTVPAEFDLLSIDIDGNDYWVWKAMDAMYRPCAVVIEYNACIPAMPAVTIPYDPSFHWDGTAYYGVSLGALKILGEQKGYRLIGTDRHGVNAFFVRSDLVGNHFTIGSLAELYHPAAFKGVPGKAHPPDTQNRLWVTVG